jgi:predicted GIY-YIG superfamily endonuclease
MFYTYILRSQKQPGAIYIGYSSDLRLRINQHNSGHSNYSSKYAPWEIESYFAFSTITGAKSFEKYLKSSSGKSFMKKHLISKQFREVLAEFNNARIVKRSE